MIGSRCSLLIAFHTYSHKHVLRFAVSTDPVVSVSSISSSPCLCIVTITAYYSHDHSEWPFFTHTHTCSAAEYQVSRTPPSNCTIAQQRGVSIINGSQLEGKMMVVRFQPFIYPGSFNQDQMDGRAKSFLERAGD